MVSSNSHFFIHAFHILFVGGLFLYVGIAQKTIPRAMFPILLGLGLIIILYHCYKAYVKIMANQNPWVNYIHILLVGPLLMYIGYNATNTPRYAFELLLMLGMASIGYHGYYLLQNQ